MEAIKGMMTSYWAERADTFSELRAREYQGYKRKLWTSELLRYLPENKKLNILDIGTGTGYFCFILGEYGHQMTGIDLTPEMIEDAKRTSSAIGIPAEFYVMDAEDPQLEPHSFDAIVTRNLTWQLPDMEKAYKKWHGLLKPGGILINFDADYCREHITEPLPENHAHKNVSAKLTQDYERMKEYLRHCQQPRPQWDVTLLEKAGFQEIVVDTDVWKRIYAEKDEFYNPTPIFTITARA